MNIMIIEWSGWLIALLSSALWLCAGVSVSLPWFSAHLAFWGWRENNHGDIEFARRLSRLCLVSLIPVLFIGAVLFLLASIRQPAVFFTSVVTLIWPLGVLLLLLFVFAVLVCAYSKSKSLRLKFGLVHPMMILPGALMGLCVGLVCLFALSNLSPTLFSGEGGWNWRFLERPVFWWVVVHFYLSAFSVGGLVLMFFGGKAFRWESTVPVSNGARWVRLGAKFSLCFLLLQAGVVGGWLLFQGSRFVREMLSSGGPFFVVLLVGSAVCIVLLLELLLGALRRGGSVRMAGSLAIFLFFILTVSVNSARLTLSQSDFSFFPSGASHHQAQGRSR